MQVFEFHFNPKLKEDLIFDSFCYEPENIYERRVGSLYLAGLLKNVLPQNIHFLDRLAKVIKDQYYHSTLITSEKSLKESLRQGNEFLEGIAKKGDVSWLGNLSFAVLSFKNFELNFTKVGEMKIILIRGGQIIDIDKKLRFQDIEPYPLKVFGNIVSGKLAENDLILVLTKEVFSAFAESYGGSAVARQKASRGGDFFPQESILAEVTKIIPFDERKFKSIIQAKDKEFLKISGICLAIFLAKEVGYPAKSWVSKKEVISPSYYKEFSLKQIFTEAHKTLCARFSPLFNYFKRLIKKPRWAVGGWRYIFFPCRAVGGWRPKLKLPKVKIPALPLFKFPKLSKNQISVLALIFFLVLGFLISQREEKLNLENYQIKLEEIQEKINQAENYLILKETNPQAAQKANLLFKESWQEISSLAKGVSTLPKDFQNQIFSLSDKISKNLFELNNLKIIETPELFFEFDSQKFIPQKMVIFDNELYFFSPYSNNLFRINQKGESEIIQINKKFNLATALSDSILFFSKPNQLVNFKNGQFNQASSLGEPYPNFNFDELSSYKSNLYFLDYNPPTTRQGEIMNQKFGEIIKYPYLENFKWDLPQLWLNPEIKKASGARSMAVDGSIWILDKDNSIGRYYGGFLQKSISLDLFPYPKEFSKIFASPYLPYLYILEPIQKRIIILTKAGEIIKQFQSKKFDNLLDFSISPDGKTIWLLNGLRVYKINL